MTKQTPKQTQAPKAKQPMPKQARKSQKPKTASNNNKGGTVIPAYLRSVADPWSSYPAHIPDEQTMRSALLRSHVRYSQPPVTVSATTTRTFGFIFPAYPYYTYFSDDMGSGSCSDVNLSGTAGTQYITPFATTGVNVPPVVSNLSSIMGSQYPGDQRIKIRCVGIGVSMTYNGTELQRAGKFIAAVIPVTGLGSVAPTTGTAILLAGAAMATTVNDIFINTSDIRKQAIKYSEARISDKPFNARWIPNCSPTYHYVNPAVSNWSSTAGIDPSGPNSIWSASEGQTGSQSGQNALIVVVEGDTIAAASTVGNPYTFDITHLWEAIPDDYDSVAYDCSPSPASSLLLDKCTNAFSRMTVANVPGNGMSA